MALHSNNVETLAKKSALNVLLVYQQSLISFYMTQGKSDSITKETNITSSVVVLRTYKAYTISNKQASRYTGTRTDIVQCELSAW